MAATKERLTIVSSIGLDSLDPYAHSPVLSMGSGSTCLSRSSMLITPQEYYGVLAESWDPGKEVGVHLKKGIRFHDGRH